MYYLFLRHAEGAHSEHQRALHLQSVHERVPQSVREAQAALRLPPHRAHTHEQEADVHGRVSLLLGGRRHPAQAARQSVGRLDIGALVERDTHARVARLVRRLRRRLQEPLARLQGHLRQHRAAQGAPARCVARAPRLLSAHHCAQVPAARQGHQRHAGLRGREHRPALHRAADGRPASGVQGLVALHAAHIRALGGHRSGRRLVQVRRRDEVRQEALGHLAGPGPGTARRGDDQGGHGARPVGLLPELPLGAQLDAVARAPRRANRPRTRAQGLSPVVDEHAESQVSRHDTAERQQDDGGAAARHQGQPAQVVQHGQRRLLQLVHGQVGRVQALVLLAGALPRRDAREAQVRPARLQHTLRVHRRRPAHLLQPAQDVPCRVCRDTLQGAQVHRRTHQLRRPCHPGPGPPMHHEHTRGLLQPAGRQRRALLRSLQSLPSIAQVVRARCEHTHTKLDSFFVRKCIHKYLLNEYTELHGVHQKSADQRHAGDIRPARQREHHVRSERDLPHARRPARAAAEDAECRRRVTRRGHGAHHQGHTRQDRAADQARRRHGQISGHVRAVDEHRPHPGDHSVRHS